MGDDPGAAPAHTDDPHVGPAHPEDTSGVTVTVDSNGLRQVTYGDLTDDSQQLQYNVPHGPGDSQAGPGWMPHGTTPPAGGTPAQLQAWQDGHHAAFSHQIGMCLSDPDLDQWYQAGYAAGQQDGGGGGTAAADPAAAGGDAYAYADASADGASADAAWDDGSAYAADDASAGDGTAWSG